MLQSARQVVSGEVKQAETKTKEGLWRSHSINLAWEPQATRAVSHASTQTRIYKTVQACESNKSRRQALILERLTLNICPRSK
jgi:hypothetical protein